MELVFVKAGGSWITFKDRPFSIDYNALEKLAEILLMSSNDAKIVLGHGGGSFAHPVVKSRQIYGDRKTLILCHKATKTLNQIIVSKLIDYGIDVLSIQTSSIILWTGRGYRVFAEPVKEAINKGLIPIVYGDCILDQYGYYRVISTEELFTVLTMELKPKRIVYLERVDGIYTKDPMKYSDAKLIPLINKENYKETLKLLKESYGIDVTGGMRTKIEKALELARDYGINSIIVSGYDVEEAVRAITKGTIKRGTLITW